MAPLAGFNTRVLIGTRAYAVAEWTVDVQAEGLEVTTTEGVPGNPSGAAAAVNLAALGVLGVMLGHTVPAGSFVSRTGGPSSARVSLKAATFDPSGNPFAFATPIRERTYQTVTVFLQWPSLLPPWTAHVFPSLLITSMKHEGQVKNLQPLTIEGETDGVFLLGATIATV